MARRPFPHPAILQYTSQSALSSETSREGLALLTHFVRETDKASRQGQVPRPVGESGRTEMEALKSTGGKGSLPKPSANF